MEKAKTIPLVTSHDVGDQYDASGKLIPPQRCYCGAELDSTTEPKTGARPKPGDVSMCIECGQALRFTETMHLQVLTDTELAALPDYVRRELRRFQRAHAMMKTHPRETP